MEMNRITFARVIATHSNVVCRIRKQKKDAAYFATSVIRGLPLELRSVSSQESDLTTEIDNRNRRAAVANIADDFSSVLRLEVLVSEVIQRALARERRRF